MRSVFAFFKEPLHLDQRQFWKQWLTYRFFGMFILVGVAIVAIIPILQQKLQNDQIELAQSEGTFAFEATLSTLPNFGQTFIPTQGGLRGVYLPIEVNATEPNGSLTLHLRSGPTAEEDVRTATLSLAELANQNVARFAFEPIPDSFNRRYYFFVQPVAEANSNTRLKLYYSEATTYNDGALYLDGQAQDFQATFWLAYDRPLMLRDWGTWLIQHTTNLLAIAALITLPGLSLLIWLWPKDGWSVVEESLSLNHIEWLALITGLSVAVYPLLLLLAHLLNLTLNSGVVVTFLLLCGLATAIGIYRQHKWSEKAPSYLNTRFLANLPLYIIRTLLSPPILLFWLIFLLSAGIRIFVMRGQDIPFWQDSYHHTMISQLLVDNGGLFDSWRPYAPIESFSYHFGFHTIVAVYHWLAGSSIPHAVITIGQLMNILTVVVAFLLGRRLTGSDWAGTFAALITGLLSEHPMFYVNWGRYTQLTGQVILPVIMILTWLAFKTQKLNYKLMALMLFALASLALTHYRVLFFYPCFVAALLFVRWAQVDGALKSLRLPLLYVIFTAVGGVVLIAPWLWRIIGSRLWDIHSTIIIERPGSEVAEAITTHPSVFDFMMPLIVILAGLGVLWGCWQRQAGILVVAGWTLSLVVLANPHFFYLPGTETVTYFAVLIASYLPLSVLAGYALSEIVRKAQSFHGMIAWLVVILGVWIGIMGLQSRISSIEYGNGMVTKPDLAAMEWIKENTPAEATFWVNARIGYVSIVTGTDAGWWIPFLAGRQSPVLPMIYDTETTDPVDYTAQIYQLYQQMSQNQYDLAKLWQIQREAGITHLYIGQRRGEVWRGLEQPLDPLLFNDSPYYRPIYHQDQVWIFALCAEATSTDCGSDL